MIFKLIKRVYEQEQMLKKDLMRMEFFALKDSLKKLNQQKTEKENRIADNNLSFPQLRDKLLLEVKRVKTRIGGLEKELKDKKRAEEAVLKTKQKLKDRLEGNNQLTEEQKKKVKIFTKNKIFKLKQNKIRIDLIKFL